VRAVWIWPSLDAFRQDVQYACRTVRKSPGFAAIVVLTLAIGTGATTAIYSVTHRILLQPLPFADSDRLVRVFENLPWIVDGRPIQGGMTFQEFAGWRERTQTLQDTIGFMPGRLMLRTGQGTARLWGGMITSDAFDRLGAHTMLGRPLTARDDAHPDVVVLGFETWRRFFSGDPSVVGTTVETLESPPERPRRLTIIGVLPEGFEFPTARMDYYMPFALNETSREWASVNFIARLRPGVSLTAATEEANVIGTALRPRPDADAPKLTVRRFGAQPLKAEIVGDLRPALRVLLASVLVVLLIVCANIANLLLARGSARQREIAVRSALGASQGRIVRQLLTESLVLAAIGGGIGALFGAGGVALVRALAEIEAPGIFRLALGTSILPRLNEVVVDLKMFGIAFCVAAIAGLVFAIVPALRLSRANQHHAIGPRGCGSDRVTSRLRSILVVGQLVMATLLLVGAVLLARSFMALTAVERGYDPSRVLAFQLVFPPEYSIPRKTETIATLLTRLRAVPEVEAAGFTRAGVLIGEEIMIGTVVPPGRTAEEMRAYPEQPRVRSVSEGYLTAVGAQVLQGRDLKLGDATAATPGIVIGRSVARRFFETGNAVGQLVDWHVGKELVTQVQVVGVVEDLRNTSPDQESYPEIFVDYRQLLALQQRLGEPPLTQEETAIGLLSFAVRTSGEAAAAAPAIGNIVRSVDPNIGIDAILPLDRLVASSVAGPRFYTVMLGAFAGVAGCLALIGIYGVLAYSVAQRTAEIGVRMALGAEPSQVMALVLRRGLVLTTVGVGLGLLAAAGGTRVLQGLLFGIAPLDPQTFSLVALVFGLVAMLACYLPARRATQVDPMAALRIE
jgi:putative ABC transport system permease protein